MKTKQETQIKKLVGRQGDIDGDYYVCDYIFKHDKDFQGATATVLRPVSQDEYDNRTNPNNSDCQDYFRELWQEAVKSGNTEQSFQDWLELLMDDNGAESVFDPSGSEYWDDIRKAEPELTEADYPVFECIGGGRSFSKGMKFDKVYDEKLLAKIMSVES